MRKFVCRWMVPGLSFFLFACGGGGGEATNPAVLSYTGATTQAMITSGTAEELMMGAYFGEQSGMSISLQSVGAPVASDSALPVRSVSQVLRRALRHELSAPGVTSASIHLAATPQSTTAYSGSCGGQFSSNVLSTPTTGSFSDSLRFEDYCEDGIVFNGLVSASGTLDTGGYMTSFSMAFHPLIVSQAGSSYTMDGQLAVSFISPQYSETVSMTFLLRDQASSQVFRFENYVTGINYGADFTEETLTGRYYHPDYGYIDLSSEPPLQTYTGLIWPSSGALRGEGGGGTFVRMVFTNATTTHLEADSDGNGICEWQKDLIHPLPPDYIPPNHPPVAEAGIDQNVFQGQLVDLDGGGSSDPDGDLLSFQWYFSSCPGNCPSLNNAASATPSFQTLGPGDYLLQLVVNDGQHSSSSDTLLVRVEPAQPALPNLLGEEWSYGRFGTYIGRSGLSVLDLEGEGNLEIVTAASPQGFGSNQYWYVLRHDVGAGYAQVFLSELSPVIITRLLATDLDNDGTGEILVGYQDGRIDIFAGDTYVLRKTFQTPGTIAALAAADLSGDGIAEIVTSDGENIYTYDASGNLLWSTTAYGGNDLAIGNVDDDPAVEIVIAASGHGYVVDADTHELEWDYINGFGVRVETGDTDGDGRDEIVAAAAWQKITLFDAELKTPNTEIVTSLDIGALRVTDLDGDGVAEILYGDSQWGSVHCYTGDGQTELWAVSNPEHGTTGLATGDVDGDGTMEVLWGAGGSSTGPDFLFVADPTAGIEWQNAHLDGPLSAVDVGDVDDDGEDEIVMVSFESNSGYDGIISIFDAATHTLEWQSTDLPNIYAWSGVNSVRIADVDDDGATEFVIATSNTYSGLVQVYNGQTHELEGQSAAYDSEPFTVMEIGDVDGDGETEIVVGTDVATTGASGAHLVVLNGATLAEEWLSTSLMDGWASVTDIDIADVDNDGQAEILVAVAGTRVYAIDGVTHQHDWLEALPASSVGAFDLDGDGQLEILVGKTDGTIGVYNGNTFSLRTTVSSLSGAAVNALNLVDLDGDSTPEWILASNGMLSVLENGSGQLLWRSRDLGTDLGRYNHLPIKDIDGDGKPEIVVGSSFALFQFD